MPSDLTPAQRALLGFVMSEVQRTGTPPTLREMCQRFKWSSTNAAHSAVRRLAEKGFVVVHPSGSVQVVRDELGREVDLVYVVSADG